MGTTTAIFVLLVGLGSTPRDEVTIDRVDLVELNHFFDDHGKLVLDQLIFYDWSPAESRYQVRAWRLLKNPAQVPKRDAADGGFVARWHDGMVLRKVYARQFRETWTQYDPELVEREFLAKDKRRDLRKVATTKWNSPPAPIAKGSREGGQAGGEVFEFVSTAPVASPMARPAEPSSAITGSGIVSIQTSPQSP
ncbi:MAG: hypothetical protein U1A77_25495 [Pirellulales bacterium]